MILEKDVYVNVLKGREEDKCDIAKVPCTKEDCNNNGKPKKGELSS